MFKKLFLKVLDLVYPIKCPICDKNFISRSDLVCKSCSSNLKNINFIKDITVEGGKLVKCVSPFMYSDDNIKKSIWRFKFRGYKDYSKFFATLICEGLKSKFQDIKFDYVTFVPIGRERQRNRGYNQSECLASDIAFILGISCNETLIKVKSNHVQHELSLEDRKENVKGVYGVKNPSKIKGKRILLCDDIVTSGSTISECSKVLFDNGANEVYCCSIANVIQCNS